MMEMKLDDFKAVWAKEQKDLESRLVLNEKLVKRLTLEKSKSNFSKLIEVSILGRNLALAYMTVSMFFAYTVFPDWQYSIPAIIGGLAMLFSFLQHFSLKKPDLLSMNTLDLQKAINQFRIHTSKYAKYDVAIVVLWIVTLIPTILKKYFKITIYSEFTYSLVFLLFIGIVLFSMNLFSKKLYKKIDLELEENTFQLDEIKTFEKE